MIKLAPSILSADFSMLKNNIEIIDEAGASMVHLDVMDGSFVPNISFGPVVIKSLRKITKKAFDVHLMIDEPTRYIDDFCNAGADIITVHAEACTHLHRTIQQIKSKNVKAAVALNPATPLNVLDYVLEDLDMVLIMSVNPGFGGQSFIPNSLDKIKSLRKQITDKGLTIDIQVDGGINTSNVRTVIEAGANIIVAGSAVFKGDIASQVKGFNAIFEEIGE
ncbi:ribulose-phosphate 3-epimerase [Natranaerovirga hydrolytica]|uniref:Ribulose-phosphate 3-epimerase n=1 Tax=Natranaerovirga hydrolytica TaxID=680378 RepID=A0A4R1N0B0_9FIRM|nr:ribulose-phosphate 3-epimerase [Natranaerovirga hydrolytica]TCK98330.1 ribulose-phosphate 3-epimerase [Natranaerovirga hydrolytica]